MIILWKLYVYHVVQLKASIILYKFIVNNAPNQEKFVYLMNVTAMK